MFGLKINHLATLACASFQLKPSTPRQCASMLSTYFDFKSLLIYQTFQAESKFEVFTVHLLVLTG
jgi:hypothetical protein